MRADVYEIVQKAGLRDSDHLRSVGSSSLAIGSRRKGITILIAREQSFKFFHPQRIPGVNGLPNRPKQMLLAERRDRSPGPSTGSAIDGTRVPYPTGKCDVRPYRAVTLLGVCGLRLPGRCIHMIVAAHARGPSRSGTVAAAENRVYDIHGQPPHVLCSQRIDGRSTRSPTRAGLLRSRIDASSTQRSGRLPDRRGGWRTRAGNSTGGQHHAAAARAAQSRPPDLRAEAARTTSA